MRDLIVKIIREEAEVKEMGISMGKLRASQPKNYLVKSLKDKPAITLKMPKGLALPIPAYA